MRIEITIQCNGPAFDRDPGGEVSRILENLAEFVSEYGVPDDKTLFDVNRNRAGALRTFANGSK